MLLIFGLVFLAIGIGVTVSIFMFYSYIVKYYFLCQVNLTTLKLFRLERMNMLLGMVEYLSLMLVSARTLTPFLFLKLGSFLCN